MSNNNPKINFYHSSETPADATKGSIWFNTDLGVIYIKSDDAEDSTWEEYGPKVKASEDNTPNYLTQDETSYALSVSLMGALHTKTFSDIRITGGPLATDQVKNAFGGDTIEAGTDLHEILTKLFCKELYPEIETIEPEFKISLPSPTITAYYDESHTEPIDHEAAVIIGSDIYFGQVYASEVTTADSIPAQLTGFTYGYANSVEDPVEVVEDEYISTNWNYEVIDEKDTYTLTPEYAEGFDDEYIPDEVSSSTVDNLELDAWKSKVRLGTCTYVVTASGPSYDAENAGIATVYAVSNLGDVNADIAYTIQKTETSNVSPTPVTAEFTVYGVYPVYTNVDSSTGDNTELANTEICKLTDTFEVEFGSEENHKNQFAFPCLYDKTSQNTRTCLVYIWNSMSNGGEYLLLDKSLYSIDGTTKTLPGGDVVDYLLWKHTGPAYYASTKFKFVLNYSVDL